MADTLIDWRSAMGKEGLRLVLKAFDEDGVTKEDARHTTSKTTASFTRTLTMIQFVIHLFLCAKPS